MNSLLYYYNNVQKMAAYQQAKRMQRGAKLGYGEKTALSSTTKFTVPPIQIGISDFTFEYFGNAYGSTLATGCNLLYQSGVIYTGSADLGINEIYVVSLAGVSTRTFRWRAQADDEKFHLVIARIGSTYTVTINNVLQDTVDMGEVKDLGNFSPVIMNSSDVGFVRVWNYALSADEIATLYNNGDPMGYVVPKAMRYSKIGNYVKYRNINNALGSNTVEVEGDTYTDITITSGTSQGYPRFVVELAEKYQGAIRVEVDAECSDEGGIIIQPVEGLSGDNNASQTITQRGIYSFTGVCNNTQYLYHSFGGALNNNKTLRLYSYKAIYCGILAEYLPHNLMESRKGPDVEPTADVFEFDIDSPYFQNVLPPISYSHPCAYQIEYVIDELDIKTEGPNPGQIGFGKQLNAQLFGTTNFLTLQPSDIGQTQKFIVLFSGGAGYVSVYAGDTNRQEFTSRRLKVRILSITKLSVPISWLDSAKQLPLSDEYMEPLFQSIGGYDMTANGAPEILYNE